ncbi:rRNA biobiogenesis protein rrp36 [Microsporum canis]|uniref:rRNA biogenesis protein RRP36 n=1 Tax=Arthroderma otae (strain ATCC MYA-4605 / CBS 113480) TaxID=554155 RepID=RRP36_ARTOC|nr:conserved hypothetical protein [Microsporum canis CBS 113480]C5FRS7.1 RecName: Full=rRNA biogenesis protein RRP36; AltName: Full=Ribosomal RNA-processing protein 36 [Microsporum canis CBS 113480]EEQ32580.1 conserved hypothetical protein [Microsporum canis CBS 113480]
MSLLGKRIRAPREDDDLLDEGLSSSEELNSASGGDEDGELEDAETVRVPFLIYDDKELLEIADLPPIGQSDLEDSPSEKEGENDIESSLSQISFGALAKVQRSLGPLKKGSKRKHRGQEEEEEEEEQDNGNTKYKKSKLDALNELRERIRRAKEGKASKSGQSKDEEAAVKKQKESRLSKHAPAIQSSKFAVSRRRVVVDGENVAQVKSRDPRFDSAVQSYSHSHRLGSHSDPAAAKNYAFLNDYRDAELKELEEKLRRAKNEDEKQQLKKTITSMNDRKRALEHRDRERQILSKHRKRERELIKEGKKEKAWFLKKADLKKEALKEKYESMGAKQRQKGIERRRKKVASKEKKEMPRSRRMVEG